MDLHLPASALHFPSSRSERKEKDAVGVKVWASLPSPMQCACSSAGMCSDRRGSALPRKRGKEKGGEKKKKIAIVLLNISLQAKLFINSGELLAFHKGEENPKQTAPQGTGLNQHLPAGSEKDVGDSSWGQGRGRQGTGALDQAGNCFGAELQPLFAGISPVRSWESHSLQRSFCLQGGGVGGEGGGDVTSSWATQIRSPSS